MNHNDFKVGVYSQIPRPTKEREIHKSHPNINEAYTQFEDKHLFSKKNQ